MNSRSVWLDIKKSLADQAQKHLKGPGEPDDGLEKSEDSFLDDQAEVEKKVDYQDIDFETQLFDANFPGLLIAERYLIKILNLDADPKVVN